MRENYEVSPYVIFTIPLLFHIASKYSPRHTLLSVPSLSSELTLLRIRNIDTVYIKYHNNHSCMSLLFCYFIFSGQQAADTHKHTIFSVSCLFGHYPSSNSSIKSQRFRDWLCLRPQVIKERARGR
jgi:hypothetical protein